MELCCQVNPYYWCIQCNWKLCNELLTYDQLWSKHKAFASDCTTKEILLAPFNQAMNERTVYQLSRETRSPDNMTPAGVKPNVMKGQPGE